MTPGARERLDRQEGRCSYLYLCSAGHVTAGVGHLVATAEDACALGFVIDGQPASEAAVRRDYAAVAAAPPGMVASAYEHLTVCRLPDAVTDMIRDADIAAKYSDVSRALPYFPELPAPAREALLDICFNCGLAGLLKFRRLLAAVEARDWPTAAVESHRRDVSGERNRETAELLLRCAIG